MARVKTAFRSLAIIYSSYEILRPLIPLIILIIASIVIAPHYFLTPTNVKVVLMQSTPLSIIATGEMLVILKGSVDLSAGSVQAAAAMLAAIVTRSTGNVALAVASAIAIGLLAGAVNGLLVTKFKIYSFVATLAGLVIWRAFVIVISQGKLIYGLSQYSLLTNDWGTYIPLGFILALAIIALVYVVLTRTTFGRYIYGIGSNEESVRLAGVRADLVKFLSFTIAGALYGVGGIMLIAMGGLAVDPWSAQGNELNAIASCVIGGIPLIGGVGSPLGPLMGAATLTILNNILVLVGITELALQQTVVGIVLIAAAASLTRGLRYVK